MQTTLEKLEEELARIQKDISVLKKIQAECDHDWDEPYEDTVKEPIYNIHFGSDSYSEIIDYKNVPCWARVCKKCEKKEITKEYGEMVIKKIMGKGPIFKDNN